MVESTDELRDFEPTPFRLPGNPGTDKRAARKLHGPGFAGMVYGNAVQRRMSVLAGGFNVADSGCNYVEDVLERMGPQDPLEEMLIQQAVLAHARVLHLTEYANRQERLEAVKVAHEYADRASNTYRRHMLALAEYRRPPRPGDSFTAIRQANIAGQQVVQNGEIRASGNATNEQGSEPARAPQALPAEPGGAGIFAGLCTPREAVGAIHGAAYRRGEVPKPDERLEAR